MHHESVLQPDPQVVCTYKVCWNSSAQGEGIGRSPGWNVARAESSRPCIYTYVEKERKIAKLTITLYRLLIHANFPQLFVQFQASNELTNTPDLPQAWRSILSRVNREDTGSTTHQESGLSKQKSWEKLKNEKANMLFDSRAEVSITDTTFSRDVSCMIDQIHNQECVGIDESAYRAIGRTKIKVTLNGSLVYYFDV